MHVSGIFEKKNQNLKDMYTNQFQIYESCRISAHLVNKKEIFLIHIQDRVGHLLGSTLTTRNSNLYGNLLHTYEAFIFHCSNLCRSRVRNGARP